MKTIEEIRKTVLAYCEELTANWSVGVQVDIENLPNAYVSRRWSNGVFDAHFLGFSIAVDRDTKDSEFALIYRLLGLETRDALAPYKSENERLQSAWMTEKARNAALVEALEEIRKPAMIISLGKATNRDRAEQLTEDHKRVRMIAQSALTTNTEKGGVNGEV